jgi:hypothetical protein
MKHYLGGFIAGTQRISDGYCISAEINHKPITFNTENEAIKYCKSINNLDGWRCYYRGIMLESFGKTYNLPVWEESMAEYKYV